MKRQILCITCGTDTRQKYSTNTPYPGEHLVFRKGESLGEFVCDYCNCNIVPGDTIVAFTIWADHGANPYRKWEDDFITRVSGMEPPLKK